MSKARLILDMLATGHSVSECAEAADCSKVYVCQVRLRAANPKRARANPEKHRENCRNWRKRHPDRSLAATISWQKRNPEKVREIRRRCASRRKAARQEHQS